MTNTPTREILRHAQPRFFVEYPARAKIGPVSTSNYHYFGGAGVGTWITWGQEGVFPFQPPIGDTTFNQYP